MSTLEVALALGSNRPLSPDRAGGDGREEALQFALRRLEQGGCRLLARSSFIETAPEDVPDEQPAYLNGCVLVAPPKGLRELFELSREIERAAGRTDKGTRRARVLDIDLVAAWQAATLGGPLAPLGPLAMAGLALPHPRAHERSFVLGPLAEIVGERRFPVPGHRPDPTVAELLAGLPGAGAVPSG